MRARIAVVALALGLAAGACSVITNLSGLQGGSAGSSGQADGAAGQSGGGASGAGGGDSAQSCNATDVTSCGTGNYCNRATSTCSPCSDFTRFDFAAPVALTKLNHFADSKGSDPDLDFPRFAGATGLIYVVSTGLQQGQIYYTPDVTQTAGTALTTVKGQSGPLLLSQSITFDQTKFNFAFDQAGNKVGGTGIHLVAAAFQSAQLSNPIQLPSPLNDPTENSYSVAVAPNEGTGTLRLWWMMGSGTGYNLVTVQAGDPTVTTLVVKDLPKGCVAGFALDATPWVTPSGTWMLFREVEQGQNCASSGTGLTDLYRVALDPSQGIPIGLAAPLTDVNRSNTMDTAPSLSADLCWLYFASNRESGQNKLRLYRAHRD